MASTDEDPAQSLVTELVKALQSQRSAEQVDLPYFRPEINESSKWNSKKCFQCGKLGHVKANCVKKTKLVSDDRYNVDESLATITDRQGSRVVRRQLPGINRVSEDFGALVTEVEVPEEHRVGLEVILQDFSGMITTGDKVGAMNNVCLKIRLEKEVVFRMSIISAEILYKTILRVSHNSWAYIEQKGNEEVQNMLRQLREGNLDANQYAEEDEMLYSNK
ncbi:unnamed protein product [Acanthoscelides obtectus]|uniref:CCHC-type domain-containing protein n=1 Tax=Acanthoscelides obtectus TaxID=200917 RepID=A0A9P0QD77_ACAOB|nr:unnamed protein product [Acanthoscelides obtectus]CAK1682689.1 hypothetical protein AOBTE_LOCUS33795 [Acanthoscelides obtectus]